jgi:hypothetical protein
MGWATFWASFPQTHLVTLTVAEKTDYIQTVYGWELAMPKNFFAKNLIEKET